MDAIAVIRASLTVGENVCHNVVAGDALSCLSSSVVDIVDMLLKLLYLSLSNRQTQFHFSSCQSDPEFSPGSEFLISGEDILHLLACVSCTEGAFIALVVIAHRKYSPFLRRASAEYHMV